ncbi:FixH family protein [Marinobacter sp.]
MTNDTPAAPWFRQPWFWFLLIFPGASIIWCTIAITVAMNSDLAMVSDDYSKEGRGINMAIARDVQAAELGLSAEFAFSGDKVRLVMASESGESQFPYLILKFFHPTLEDRDRTLQLRSLGNGEYAANAPRNLDGRWYVDLQGPSNDWRLKGEFNLPSSSALRLEASAGPG